MIQDWIDRLEELINEVDNCYQKEEVDGEELLLHLNNALEELKTLE